jgi:hypothetical protein
VVLPIKMSVNIPSEMSPNDVTGAITVCLLPSILPALFSPWQENSNNFIAYRQQQQHTVHISLHFTRQFCDAI